MLDPCCGTGAVLDVVHSDYGSCRAQGIELNEGRAATAGSRGYEVLPGDALERPTLWIGATRVCTNPPYSLARQFIEMYFRMLPHAHAAFLLRLNFLGSDKRAKFHIAHPADIFVLSKRPEFVMSVKCSQRKKYGCTYEEILPIEAPRPEGCPLCGFSVTVSKTDATEYAWFLYGPGRGGRYAILDVGEG